MRPRKNTAEANPIFHNDPAMLASYLKQQNMSDYVEMASKESNPLQNLLKSDDYGNFIKKSNDLTAFVNYTVLNAKNEKGKNTPAARAKQIEYFIDVIREALKINDFYTAATLMGALNSSDLRNLAETQSLVSQEQQTYLASVILLISSGKKMMNQLVDDPKTNTDIIPHFAAIKSLVNEFNEGIEQNKLTVFRVINGDVHANFGIQKEIADLISRKHIESLINQQTDSNLEEAKKRVIEQLQSELRPLIEEYLKQRPKVELTEDQKSRLFEVSIPKLVNAVFSMKNTVRYTSELASAYPASMQPNPEVGKEFTEIVKKANANGEEVHHSPTYVAMKEKEKQHMKNKKTQTAPSPTPLEVISKLKEDVNPVVLHAYVDSEIKKSPAETTAVKLRAESAEIMRRMNESTTSAMDKASKATIGTQRPDTFQRTEHSPEAQRRGSFIATNRAETPEQDKLPTENVKTPPPSPPQRRAFIGRHRQKENMETMPESAVEMSQTKPTVTANEKTAVIEEITPHKIQMTRFEAQPMKAEVEVLPKPKQASLSSEEKKTANSNSLSGHGLFKRNRSGSEEDNVQKKIKLFEELADGPKQKR